MEQQNFFAEQLIGVAEMMKIQQSAATAIKQILTSLLAEGIQTGLNVTPTAPGASLAVVVKAGQLASKAGAFVVLANDLTIDLTAQGVVALAGGSRWISIIAVASQVSDTPVVTPGGVVQYRTFDSVNFQLVFGAEALAGQQAVKPTADVTSGGVIIADIKRVFGQASFQVADIDMTRAELWLDIQDIIALINNHVTAIDHVAGLQAALDGKAPLNHTHPLTDVFGLVAALAVKLETTIIDYQGSLAAVVLDGTDKTIFTKLIPAGTIKAGKGMRLTLTFTRPVGFNVVKYNLKLNGNAIINLGAYQPIAVTGNANSDTYEIIIQNLPGQVASQIVSLKGILNSGQAGANTFTTTNGVNPAFADFTLDQTLTWTANGPGPDQVSPVSWLLEHLR